MKKLLIVALVISSCSAMAQTPSLDSGFMLPAGQSIILSHGKITCGQTVYKDTIPDLYIHSSGDLMTLKTEKGGGDGSEQHPDTTLVWNHFGYMVQVIDKEIDHWSKAFDIAYTKFEKTGHAIYFREHLACARRLEYWNGVRAGIQFVMHQRYYDAHFRYDFKTYKKPSER